MKTQEWKTPEGAMWQEAELLVQRLHAAGYVGVFVGGCVRDQLLGRAVHDVDVATDATPDQVEAVFPNAIGVGKAFGVMVVPTAAGRQVEIASFRSDGAYIDGRRPTGVELADEATDVERRDFTINALIADPVAGVLRDRVGGLDDLQQRVLRVVGDPVARLQEDKLRVLRAWRFAATLSLTIDPASEQALQAVVQQGLAGVSRERIWEEWKKAMSAPSGRADWLRLAIAHGGLEIVCPLFDQQYMTDQVIPIMHQLEVDDGELIASTLLFFALSAQPEFAGWLKTEPVAKQWQRQRVDCAQILRGRDSWIDDEIACKRHARHGDAAVIQRCLQLLNDPRATAFAQTINTEHERGAMPRFLNGADLQQYGINGPAIGQTLRMLEDEWLAGRITNAAEAHNLVQNVRGNAGNH